jgi:hypothetical protein
VALLGKAAAALGTRAVGAGSDDPTPKVPFWFPSRDLRPAAVKPSFPRTPLRSARFPSNGGDCNEASLGNLYDVFPR